MSPHIGASLARLVRKRAGNVCEYCCLPQSSQEATFHVDQIQPAVAQGLTTPDNVALACVRIGSRHLFPPNDFRWDSEAPPTTELASVVECSQPECGIGRPLATMRLVRVERCFRCVFPGTSLHGGEFRGGVATSLGRVLVANIARRGQAPPWRQQTPAASCGW